MSSCSWCGSGEYYSTSDGRLKCKRCRRKFSLTSRTRLHGRKLPLEKYEQIADLVRRGLNAAEISRRTGVGYKSARLRVRQVLDAPRASAARIAEVMSDEPNPAEVLPPAPAVAAEARLHRLRAIGARLDSCESLDAALPVLAELMVMVVEAPFVVAREPDLRPAVEARDKTSSHQVYESVFRSRKLNPVPSSSRRVRQTGVKTNSPRAAEADERRNDQPAAAEAPDADPISVQPDLSGIGGRGESSVAPASESKSRKPRRSTYVGSAAWWKKRGLAKIPDNVDAQVADFVARRGVTQCPPAFAAPSVQGERHVSSIPELTRDPDSKKWGRFG